jgi:hypothetical protein
MKITQSVIALIAMSFGLVTLIVGTSVLLGSDPGYIIFRPLLFYNTIMGIVYVLAGVLVWRNLKQGMYVAVTIFVLNLVVLVTIYFLYTEGKSIAFDSLRAMSLRTIVWFAIFAGLGWLSRKNKLHGVSPDA